MSKKQKTSASSRNGLSINTNEEKNQSCYTEIIDKHHAQLEDMTQKHSKVMQVRFDLRYPQNSTVEPTPQHLHDFNYNLQRKLKREKHSGGHQVDPRVLVTTEKHGSEHPHIHGVLLVNANAKQNYYPLIQEVEKQWKTALKTDVAGLVDYCDKNGKNGMIINRNSEDYEKTRHELSHQASYLAKTRGKDNNQKGSWLVSGTRLPKNK